MTEPTDRIRALPRRFRVEVLTPEEVSRVHEAALEILGRTGIATNSRTLLERNRVAGLMVTFTGTEASPADIDLEDVVVQDTESRESDGETGSASSVH